MTGLLRSKRTDAVHQRVQSGRANQNKGEHVPELVEEFQPRRARRLLHQTVGAVAFQAACRIIGVQALYRICIEVGADLVNVLRMPASRIDLSRCHVFIFSWCRSQRVTVAVTKAS